MKKLFSNGTKIEVSKNNITVQEDREILIFNDEEKPVFSHETGETVIEYTGLATDKNQDRSWAKVTFTPGETSPAHHHKLTTEDYYIISGDAKAEITINGIPHKLASGDFIRIYPDQRHTVKNVSKDQALAILVKCSPSWTFSDHLLERKA